MRLEYDYINGTVAKKGAVTKNLSVVLTFGCGYRISAVMVRVRLAGAGAVGVRLRI